MSQISLPTGLTKRIDDRLSKCPTQDRLKHVDLEKRRKTMEDFCDRVAKQKATVKGWSVNSCSKQQELRQEIRILVEEGKSVAFAGNDALDSISHYLTTEANKTRSEKTALRHARDRYGDALLKTKTWGKVFARSLQKFLHYFDVGVKLLESIGDGAGAAGAPSSRGANAAQEQLSEKVPESVITAMKEVQEMQVVQVLNDPTEFSMDEVAIWSPGTPTSESFKKYQGSCKESLQAKMHAADSKLTREKKWPGLVGKVLCGVENIEVRLADFKVDGHCDDGKEGWVYSLRKNISGPARTCSLWQALAASSSH